MTSRPIGTILYATIVAASALTAHAEAPVNPDVAKPKATKPEAAKPPATADVPPHAKMALKLAGLVAFVANSCPGLKPDYPRFKATVSALGVNVADLDKPGMKTSYLAYTSQYQTDIKTNCAKAREQFGPGGKTVPDIFGAAK